jgi:hypothetical protein
VCPACGAPPETENRTPAEGTAEGVRAADLEPYVTLRYIARLFKVLAVLVLIVMIFETILGLMRDGMASLPTIITEVTQLLVISGVMWAAGDIMVLLIDMGHDIRVARILLGRINAQLHKRDDLKS